MLHRPLRRPLAAVLLLSLVDYALWNWSLGANHDIVALVAGLTLIPNLIALAWLLLLGATRLAGDAARRAREHAATRAASDGGAFRGRPRRAPLRAALHAAALGRGAQRAGAHSAARPRHTAPGAGDQDAVSAGASSSKLAA